MGQHAHGHEEELTDDIRRAAAITVARANELCELAGVEAMLRSGWRPAGFNEVVPGAAAKSTHITAEAVDIADDDGALRGWCMLHTDAMEAIGLWMEDGRTTPTWLHIQTRPPASGKRVYIPNADWARRLATNTAVLTTKAKV